MDPFESFARPSAWVSQDEVSKSRVVTGRVGIASELRNNEHLNACRPLLCRVFGQEMATSRVRVNRGITSLLIAVFTLVLFLTPDRVSAQEDLPLTEMVAQFVRESVETFHRCGDAPASVPLRPDTTFYGIPHNHPNFSGSDRANLHRIVSAGLRLQDATRVGDAEAVGSLAHVIGEGQDQVDSLIDTLNEQARSDFPIILVASRLSPDVALIKLHIFGKAGDGHYACPASREFVVSLDTKETADLPDGSETYYARYSAMPEVLEDIRRGMQGFEAIDVSLSGDRCELTQDISDELLGRWTTALGASAHEASGRPGLPKFRPPQSTGKIGPGIVEIEMALDHHSNRLVKMRVRGMDVDGNTSVHRLYRVLVDPGKGQACRQKLQLEKADELERLRAEAHDAGAADGAAQRAELAAQVQSLQAELSKARAEGQRLIDIADAASAENARFVLGSTGVLEGIAEDLRKAGHIGEAERVLEALSKAETSDAVVASLRMAMAAFRKGTSASALENLILRSEGCSDRVRTSTGAGVFRLTLEPGCMSTLREQFRLYLGLHDDHIRTDLAPQEDGSFLLEVPFTMNGAGLGYRTDLPDGNGTIALPSIESGQTNIVLAWAGPIDLDLHIFENGAARGAEGHVRLNHPGIGEIEIDHSRQTPQSTRFAVYSVETTALDQLRIAVGLGEGPCRGAERKSFRVYKFEDGKPQGTSGRQIVDCDIDLSEVTLQ